LAHDLRQRSSTASGFNAQKEHGDEQLAELGREHNCEGRKDKKRIRNNKIFKKLNF
jgi:hypothetical protein